MSFGYIAYILLGICLYLVVQNKKHVEALQNELKNLRNQMQKNCDELLARHYAGTPSQDTLLHADEAPEATTNNAEAVSEPEVISQAETVSAVPLEKKTAESVKTIPVAETKPAQSIEKPELGFEQKFAARLPVWIGGVALAFAGFFLVKYSLDHGLISAKVRLFFSGLFGIALLIAGSFIRKKTGIANGDRIAQALSGAGIVTLYASLYASAQFYTFIPLTLAFIGMAAVTALAIFLSLKHGLFIALLGLIGGFLTPALLSSGGGSALALFFYLYCVFAGLMFAIRKKGWWLLSSLAVAACFGWVLLWLFNVNFHAGESIYLGLFVIAVSVTVILSSRASYEEERALNKKAEDSPLALLNYLTLGGGLLLWGIVTAQANFGAVEWGLFFLLSTAAIALAFLKPKLYEPLPWVALAANAVLFLFWWPNNDAAFLLTLALFGTLFAGSGYVLQSRSPKPVFWAALCCVTALGYYLIGVSRFWSAAWMQPFMKGAVALGLAAVAAYTVSVIIKKLSEEHNDKQKLLALYAGSATAFLALGFVAELPVRYLPLAFAAQSFALAWLDTRLQVTALRYLSGLIAAVFAALLVPQVLSIMNTAITAKIAYTVDISAQYPIIAHPLLMLGVPAILLAVASYWLRQKEDDPIVSALEGGAIILTAMTGYFLIRHGFHEGRELLILDASFSERGVITNFLFVLGLACLWVGQRFKRIVIAMGGLVLCGIALFRIVAFDLVMLNPLWSAEYVGEWWLLNALLLAYGLPAVWCGIAVRLLADEELPEHVGKGLRVAMTVLALIWLSMNVRQFFKGAYLNSGQFSNAEIYTYSAVWLLFGIGLLFFGTLKKSKMLRLASMGIIMLTIAKVFLYDASALDGLLRVFSFFGLGLSLLGVSWFYTRFVFTGEEQLDENK